MSTQTRKTEAEAEPLFRPRFEIMGMMGLRASRRALWSTTAGAWLGVVPG